MESGRAARRYRTREFAQLTGVTARALYHYDRLGLLRPVRTSNGYRAYADDDFIRLEQIVALKFIGIPLRRMRTLLLRDAREIAGVLRKQRAVLERKRLLLDQAIEAVQRAELAVAEGARPDVEILQKIIEVMEMQNDAEWPLKYYNEAAREKIAERRQTWSPELQEQVSRRWLELIHDVEVALGDNPAGEKGQALAARWSGLVEEFTGGDADVTNGLHKLYEDKLNWPSEATRQMQPFRITPEIWGFIERAMAAHAVNAPRPISPPTPR